jgi:hypothetical protein
MYKFSLSIKSFFLILLLGLFPIAGNAQHAELKNKIIWEEDRPLTWDDFKGTADAGSKFYALTNSGIYYQVQQESWAQFAVSVETFFDPKQSWQKKDQVTDHLLQHEQLHFNIHELYSRLFIKSMIEAEFNDEKMVFIRIRELYARALQDAQDFSNLYDKETNHSVNKVEQMVWNKKVNALLEETKEFDLKEISLEVK